MEAYRIGQQLRAVVHRDRQEGRPFNPRRLQSVIEDLCGAGQQDLAAPLRYLVLSAAFASAAGMDPPLSDGRQLPRLQNELAQTFAAPLCARLQPLLEGLLGLEARAAAPSDAAVGAGRGAAGGPAAGAAGSSAMPSSGGQGIGVVTAGHAVPAAPVVVSAAGSEAGAALTTVLAFLSGLLLMALAGLGLLLWQRQSSVVSVSPAPAPRADAQVTVPQTPASPQAAPAPVSTVPAAGPVAAVQERAAVDRAVSGIQQLYQALSSKDFSQAQALFGSAAADQFDPSFFRQFERVSVQDLRTTSQTGSTVNLEGVVTFVWPDGAVQSETRTFSVDTSSTPPVIIESEFGRVLRARG